MALAQSEWIAGLLRDAGHVVTLLPIVTTGDRWSASGATETPKGLFVTELEEALRDGRADIAVHSAKDLPSDLPLGLGILAVPSREDPRDVLVGVGDLADLPNGARVGTGSPRRAAQLRRHRPDLDIGDIRGNVGTRLEKLDRGEFDALVLAAAGLTRLGLAPSHLTSLPIEVCVPAPGQGALAIEGRRDDRDVATAVGGLIDPDAMACVGIERALLQALGGGCREPIGVLATSLDGVFPVDVFAAAEDDSTHTRQSFVLSGVDDPLLGEMAGSVRAVVGRRVAGGQ